jgi:hypothetical protein
VLSSNATATGPTVFVPRRRSATTTLPRTNNPIKHRPAHTHEPPNLKNAASL